MDVRRGKLRLPEPGCFESTLRRSCFIMEPKGRFMKNILVPVDFSDATGAVVARATDLAKALQAQITLLHVVAPEPDFVGYEPGPQSVRDTVAKHVHEEHKQLQALEKMTAGQGVPVTSLLIQGYTAEKILKECERLKSDLIVMGSHGHSALHNLLVGSVAEGVLRKASCPVVVVPRAKSPPM